MASSPQGSAGLGLSIAGMGAGILGSALATGQNKQDKRIANGQEDPALAALRKRLAAQNAQTAMSVAASQQGVNPALAQRNAQQALAQQQVQTNANLAQHNANSTLQSREANRGAQAKQVTGTLLGAAQGLNALGAQYSTTAAQTAAAGGSQGPVTDAAQKAKFMDGAPGVGAAAQPLQSAPEAQVMSAPIPLSAAPIADIPVAQPVVANPLDVAALQASGMPSAAEANPYADAMSANRGSPVGELQMQGGAPRVVTDADIRANPNTPVGVTSAGAVGPWGADMMSTDALQEQKAIQSYELSNGQPFLNAPRGQFEMRGADAFPSGSPGQMQARPATSQVATPMAPERQIGGPVAPAPAMTPTQAVAALPDEVRNDPAIAPKLDIAASLDLTDPAMAEIIRKAILNGITSGGL